MAEEGTWVYAVTEGSPGRGLTGVAGEAVRGVDADGLTAVVGTVPRAGFGDEALRRNLEDLDWLARVARAHDAVVVALPRPVVPFRLATVYFDDDRVAELLHERGAGFRATLARLAGCSEWGVKITLDVSAPRSAAPVPTSGGPGMAYLSRRREERRARDRVDEVAARHAREIHAALAALAGDARLHRPHGAALTGTDRQMILNGAYLVPDRAGREFARAAADHGDRHEGLELEVTGPWPAYSFTSPGPTP
ncbi:MAG: GvpL/GvpF family gas vesicle protein [Saccharothrix sp.]|nr:GvpL/GvpF family gas vesicle protein [Saccharothrix sp.]